MERNEDYRIIKVKIECENLRAIIYNMKRYLNNDALKDLLETTQTLERVCAYKSSEEFYNREIKDTMEAKRYER